jgi:hypothetical protein
MVKPYFVGCTRYMEPDDDPGSCAAIDAWLRLPAGSVEEATGVDGGPAAEWEKRKK